MSPRTQYQVASRQLLRSTIFDAARTLLREHLWSAVSMAQIAKQASVSRQTVYNEFGSREGFLQAYIIDDAERVLTIVGTAMMQGSSEPRHMIERAFLAFLDTVRADPLPIKDTDDGPDQGSVLRMLTYGGAPLLESATVNLSKALHQVWPTAKPDDCRRFCEQLVRLSLSHTVLPDGRLVEEVAADVAQFLTPIADSMLAAGQSADNNPSVTPVSPP